MVSGGEKEDVGGVTSRGFHDNPLLDSKNFGMVLGENMSHLGD